MKIYDLLNDGNMQFIDCQKSYFQDSLHLSFWSHRFLLQLSVCVCVLFLIYFLYCVLLFSEVGCILKLNTNLRETTGF